MLAFAEFHTFCAGIDGIGRGADDPAPRRCGAAMPGRFGAGASAGAMSSGRGAPAATPIWETVGRG